MTGLSLTTLANFAEIIGAVSILTGLTIGALQIRHYRVQQRDAIATNLMQTFCSRDLATIHRRSDEPAHIKYRDWKP